MSTQSNLFEMSCAQQQFWLAEQLTPGTAMNNIQVATPLEGHLDIQTLKHAIDEIVKRHETLRTTFLAVDGQAVQQVAPILSVELPIVDIQGAPDTYAEVRRAAREQIQQPFDLESGPLFRMTLLRLSQNACILLVTMHHMISDGWSLGVLEGEIRALYKAFLAGKPSPLPDIPIQYSQFAAWHRKWLQEGVLERELQYWRKQLEGVPQVLELPTDRPRPIVRSFSGARHSFQLSRALADKLKALSQTEGVTLFMTLLASFQVLLHRYSRQNDIIVGTPTANRNRTDVEGLIGLFVNTIVLRTDLSGDPSFRELLSRVRQVATEAYSHQETPFEKLLEELVTERNSTYAPLFQVMFVLQNVRLGTRKRRQKSQSSSLIRGSQIDTGLAKFDLTLTMIDSDDGIETSITYSTDLFEDDTIQRMAGHLETLLGAIVANPEHRISELPLLTEFEYHQIIREWNSTDCDFGPPQPIHRLFEAQSELTPHSIALVFEDHRLTYQQLNDYANRLAAYLRNLGVGEEKVVGLWLDRSVEQIVGLLAILKTGGAYVPLDTSCPSNRLNFILGDTKATVLLTQERLLGNFRPQVPRIVRIDVDWEAIFAEPVDNLGAEVQPETLAYVLYTSGSTGQPKGVAVEHRQLWNYTRAIMERLEWEPGFSSAMVQPLTVDSCLTSIFPPLCSGGTLHVISQDRAASPGDLAEYFQRNEIDCLKIAPSHLAALQASPFEKQLMPRKRLVIGGEASRWDWVSKLPAISPETMVVSHYGPTETTVGVLSYRVEPGQDDQLYSTTPLGRPFANTQVYILDTRRQPVPIGIPGEIYIGGANVARGYLNRPELTAESFIPDTLCFKSGGRLYKTGDRARYLPDGNLEFLSRTDDQVKIRGFRVELKEIEAVLRHHPQVQEAMVLCRKDLPENRCLVAYIVGGQAGALDSELRGFLREHLPTHMIPSSFVQLAALPRTAHGKVDRQALPAPEPQIEGESYIAPRNRTEQILADLWRQALRVERVGTRDNFFELGGDSILSIQIIARAMSAGLRFTAKQFFQHQTIAELASVAGSCQSVHADQGLVFGPVPLTPIQHRFFDQHHPQPDHFNQAFLLEVPRASQSEHWERVVQFLIEHHDALRLRFTQEESGWIQRIVSPDKHIPFMRFDLSGLSERQQKNAMRKTASQLQASLNLAQGPIISVALFDLGVDRASRLLVIIHHLAIDAVSWRILLEDVRSLYDQISRGESPGLPPKTTSFKYWAERLSGYAYTPELHRELGYWITECKKSASRLPVDFPEGCASNTEETASSLSVSLSIQDTSYLLRDLPKLHRTQINDVLLTALAEAFHQWAGANTLMVDLEGHGREDLFDDVDLSRTVGWFTSIFPTSLSVPEGPLSEYTLKSIKEQLRRVPRHGVGYGILRYLSGDELTQEMQFAVGPEISFNYLGQLDQDPTGTLSLSLPRHSKSGTPSKSSRSQDLRGQKRSGLSARHHILEFTGSVIKGQLLLTCTYSRNIHRHSTIDKFLNLIKGSLQLLLARCRDAKIGLYSPSDHPLAKLDQQTLDRLVETNREVEQVYPLAPLQDGMLFQVEYSPESRAYIGQYSREFSALNVPAFKRAWRRVVDRHPALRTSFLWKGVAGPVQIVHRKVELSWEQQDWRGLSPAEVDQRLKLYLHTDRERGFDLSAVPLMRMALFRVGHNDYQFVWTHHQLLSDGWSTRLVMREVTKFYEAFSAGRDPHLKRPRPYRDYIAWLQRVDLASCESFWRRYLSGFTSTTLLPMDYFPGGSRVQRASDREVSITLSGQQTVQVENLARQHHLTLNTVFLGAWALLLSRYTGENDIVFGTVVSGRPTSLAGVESMVGLFINTLPARIQVSPEKDLISWLHDIQTQQSEAREYQFNSLAQIQQWSGVPHGSPLLESILVFENYPSSVSKQNAKPGSRAKAYERVNYLTIIVLPSSEVEIKALYDSSRFETTTITRMLQHLRNLLNCIVAAPGSPVFSMSLTDIEERQQLLVNWNDTSCGLEANDDLLGLFNKQVESQGKSRAYICQDSQITYEELDRRSEHLALRLKQQGVGPEVIVGICLERSLELAIALLGVLKAQGAFLPLDPSYPRDRLTFMLQDSGASVLITRDCFSDMFETGNTRVLLLDQVCIEASLSLPTAESRATPDQLAYLVYTSGSTGRPKGVAVNHRQILNRFAWMWKAYPFIANEVCCQKTAFNFVDSIWEFLGPLLQGIPVVIIPDAILKDPVRLVECLAQNHVTRIWVVPSFLRMILDTNPSLQELLPDLQFWVSSGEQLPRELLRRFCRSLPQSTLYNLYGTSEIWDATWYEPRLGADQDGRGNVPIGRPISNVQAYVLDPHMQVQPVGVPGELYIAGTGLARGYVNRPDLTAEKFVFNPYSRDQNARMYRTGDLARYLPDGNLECLGRVDHQIKIRGFRVELGEIQSLLTEHASVREAAVVAYQESVHEVRLVAYVVPVADGTPDWQTLREYLQRHLPEYMVPSAFVSLEALPLTPNGKLDRNALPKPDSISADTSVPFTAPRNPVEQALASLWSEMLGVDPVGIYDNFFKLGGHSLRAMQVVSRIHERFNVDLSLRHLFESPTIAGLSSAIANAGQQSIAHVAAASAQA